MSLKINIQIFYFAILSEYTNCRQEAIDVEVGTNARNLYALLQQRYKFLLPSERIRVAINEDFTSWDQQLKEGDSIAFIPPVSGG